MNCLTFPWKCSLFWKSKHRAGADGVTSRNMSVFHSFKLFLNVHASHSLPLIYYLVSFAHPKKYSHCGLHEYKLNSELVMSIFSSWFDATRIPKPYIPFFSHQTALINHILPLSPSSPFHQRAWLLMKENKPRFLNSSHCNMTTGPWRALEGPALTLSC